MTQLKHGRAYKSRGDYARERKWLSDDNMPNELEGGKDFPTQAIAGLGYSEDTVTATIPTDGYICSGGKNDERDVVNYTNTQLQSVKGATWPRATVKAGQVFNIDWVYTAPHVTRGYNYWITKDGWNPDSRITVDQLESVPFHKDHYTEIPWYNNKEKLLAKPRTSVTLPQKTGYHVMIVPWLIADTGMAFYQTFDLDFGGSTTPGPNLSIYPSESTVKYSTPATFVVLNGKEGDTYEWSLPGKLLFLGDDGRNNVTYDTSKVTGPQNFNISCRVIDKSGNATILRANLKVGDGNATPAPDVSIYPNTKTVTKGTPATFVIENGKAGYTYHWYLPSGLLFFVDDNSNLRDNVTYDTSAVKGSKTFDISCKVTNASGNYTTVHASLTVEDPNSRPVVSIMPSSKTVKKGESANFHVMAEGTEGPFNYSWSLEDGLTSADGSKDRYEVTCKTDNTVVGKTYKIACAVWGKNGLITIAEDALLTVVDNTQPEPDDCTDPDYDNGNPWNPAKDYDTSETVHHNKLLWRNEYWVGKGETPGVSPAWELVSKVALKWNAAFVYQANRVVNHNGSQWLANYYAPAGDEPGSAPMWVKLGAASCSISSKASKSSKIAGCVYQESSDSNVNAKQRINITING